MATRASRDPEPAYITCGFCKTTTTIGSSLGFTDTVECAGCGIEYFFREGFLQPDPESFVRVVTQAALERKLTDDEFSFYRRLMAEPADRDTVLVFSDWLEERDRPGGAESLRRLHPEPDEVIFVSFPRGLSYAEVAMLREELQETFPNNKVLLYSEDVKLTFVASEGELLNMVATSDTTTQAGVMDLQKKLSEAFPGIAVAVVVPGTRLAHVSYTREVVAQSIDPEDYN